MMIQELPLIHFREELDEMQSRLLEMAGLGGIRNPSKRFRAREPG